MARIKPTKNLAKRIDSSYIARSHPMRRWRRGLTWFAGAAALAWVVFASVRVQGGKLHSLDRVYSPGPVSAAHAMIQNDCRACHAGTSSTGGFVRSITDEACLKCHDGAIHAAGQKLAENSKAVSRLRTCWR